MSRKKSKNLFSKKNISFVIFVIMTIATYISGLEEDLGIIPDVVINEMSDTTKVFFIDVSQGDSSLIITGDQAILIDAGRNADEENVTEFIREQGITNIDLIIGTHPHEDHIGGIDAVIENFVVDKLLIPDVPYNTITYEDVITAAEENHTDIIYPEDNYFFEFDSGLTLSVLLPPDDFNSSNTNDDSIVCRVVIGDTSIFYTGDMEEGLEKVLLSQVQKSDILKVGHHGSNTSSTQDFLNAVDPSIAIISCGFNNKYGHPHMETMDKLNKMGVEIRQTQFEGDIMFEFEPVSSNEEILQPVA